MKSTEKYFPTFASLAEAEAYSDKTRPGEILSKMKSLAKLVYSIWPISLNELYTPTFLYRLRLQLYLAQINDF